VRKGGGNKVNIVDSGGSKVVAVAVGTVWEEI